MPGSNGLIIICIAFLLYLTITISQKSGRSFSVFSFLLLNAIMFFSGYIISYSDDVQNNVTWFGKNINTRNAYLARVTDAPSEKERSWKVAVNMISMVGNGKIQTATGKAFIYLYKDGPMLLHKGDSILVPGKWQLIKNAGNPFEFNYAEYCRRNNIYYEQSCSPNNIRLYAAADPATTSFVDKAHNWCMQQLDNYITDAKTKGLMQAMLLGDEVNLDQDIRQSYSDTGIVHIIAISGSHVTIIFMVISALFWWLKHKKHLWVKYAFALPLVWMYVLMAGASPSAIRAALMFSLLAFSIMFQKNSNNLNLLFAAAFLVLCIQPAWLLSTGFQLSFVAVLSIILFYKRVYSWFSPSHKIIKFIWASAAASIAVEILIAPLVIYYFHSFPLLFIIVNVLAYLFMGVVLILGIAIIALSFAPPVAQVIGICTVWIVTFFNKIVIWMQAIDPASFHFLVLKNVELLLTYIVITGIALFLIKRQKAALFTALATACVLLISFCNDEWINLHRRLLVVYNTEKNNQAELINDKTYSVLNTDTSVTKKIAYAVNPAHTNFAAWREEKISPTEIVDLNGETMLFLNHSIEGPARFPVNYLFINDPKENDPVKLQKIFSPSMIILGNNYPRHQADKFVSLCARNNIKVHVMSGDGAFILNY